MNIGKAQTLSYIRNLMRDTTVGVVKRNLKKVIEYIEQDAFGEWRKNQYMELGWDIEAMIGSLSLINPEATEESDYWHWKIGECLRVAKNAVDIKSNGE